MSGAPARIEVWDAPVRLFHWSVVGLFAFSWWSAEEGRLDWHRLSGYAMLALVLFRIAWGLVGSESARFRHFLRGPGAVLTYFKSLLRNDAEAGIGHTPAGGWAIVTMLLLLLAQCIMGLFAVDVDGIESGPLSAFLSFEAGRIAAAAHHLAFNALLALVVLHLAAIAFYAFVKRDNLVGPMITGAKRVSAHLAPPKKAAFWRAMASFALAIGVVYATANAFWLR